MREGIQVARSERSDSFGFVSGLTVRVPVDLATYRRLAEDGRREGLTVERAASRLLSAATSQSAPEVEVGSRRSRWVVTPSGYLRSGPEGRGTTSTRAGMSASVSSLHPAPCWKGVDPPPVGPSESEVGHE